MGHLQLLVVFMQGFLLLVPVGVSYLVGDLQGVQGFWISVRLDLSSSLRGDSQQFPHNQRKSICTSSGISPIVTLDPFRRLLSSSSFCCKVEDPTDCARSQHGGLSLQDGLSSGVPGKLGRGFSAIAADGHEPEEEEEKEEEEEEEKEEEAACNQRQFMEFFK
ncbi:hypothetical protein INR49_025556 [Caranx melampygus]|nr:hypothetical protein INR49_025556 [Caranx melampygus]